MLRDRFDQPIGDGFVHHGTDVETQWQEPVPYLTPNDRFFVRNHTAPPRIDARSWRLLVSGDGVIGDTTYSLADLRAFTSRTVDRALECTGNGRRLFGEQQGAPRPGTQWGLGAIGVARWTGVPLATVLRHAALRDDAVQVTAVGLDDPYVEEGVNHGRVRRPLPIAKALDDVLVAWAMNGEPLPLDHGYPVRLVVPGFYGTYWVKHLSEITVVDELFAGFWMGTAYRIPDTMGACVPPGTAPKSTVPIGRFNVRSFITSHADAATLPLNRETLVRGIAFDGGAGITEVLFSADGGRSWRTAQLGKDLGNYSFREWTLPFTPTAAGPLEWKVRATNRLGESQPLEPLWNPPGYMRNVVETVKVNVAA